MDQDGSRKCQFQSEGECSDDLILLGELTIVQKAQICKETDKTSFCKNHFEQQHKLFFLHQRNCCDPLGSHQKVVKSQLRDVTEKYFSEFGHIVDIAVGQKLCANCANIKIPCYVKDYLEANQSSESQDTYNQIQEELPPDSEHSSAGHSVEVRLQDARQTVKGVQEILKISERLGKSSKRSLEGTFDEVTESLSKKMKIINPEFESSVERLDTNEAKYFREMIQQLKDKLPSCENSRERYLLLSVLPKSWSSYEIQKRMGVSQYTATRLKELVENQGILCLVPSKSGRALDSSVLQLIEDFYTSDEMSRIQPGQNDFVKCNMDGKEVTVQTRLLLCNLKECYQAFKDEYPDLSVGFSRFAEARPPCIILAGAAGTHTVCVCKIHQNPKLLLHALDLESLDSQGRKWDYKSILSRMMCNPPTQECHFGDCVSCPPLETTIDEIGQLLQDGFKDKITFKQWTNVDRSALESLTWKSSDVVNMLRGVLPDLLQHDFLAKEQSRFLKERKKSLAIGEVLAGGDFSENLSFTVQDEVQDYHWSNDQVTIHPWVCYFLDENGQLQHISIIMISDHMKHDYVAVYTFQQHLIKILKEKIPELHKIIYMSDGAASQYKNKNNFHNLCLHQTDFGVVAEWHFSTTSHGKGPCDGAGGRFKRAVRRASLQRPVKDQITTVKDLLAWSENFDTKMIIEFVPKEEVLANQSLLDERNQGVKTIQGTRSYHSFQPLNEEEIRVRRYSSSQEYEDVKVLKTKRK